MMIDIYFCTQCAHKIPLHFSQFVMLCAQYFDDPKRCCPYIPISYPMPDEVKSALRNIRYLEVQGFVVTREVETDRGTMILIRPNGVKESKDQKELVFCLSRDNTHANI